MILEVPVRGADRLPDAVQIRLARDLRRVRLLRVLGPSKTNVAATAVAASAAVRRMKETRSIDELIDCFRP